MSTHAFARRNRPNDELDEHIVLVCLHRDLADPQQILSAATGALAPHTQAPVRLCGSHFRTTPGLGDWLRSRLITPGCCSAGLSHAGGPAGLLDLQLLGRLVARVAVGLHTIWCRAVRGTPPATPWCTVIDTLHADSDPAEAVDAFLCQPRIQHITSSIARRSHTHDLCEDRVALQAH